MNTLLDRYLYRQFVANLLLVLCALVSIYFLVDFFERIDNFLEQKKGMALVLRYFLLKIPSVIDLLQPVCILLAGVITLGLLNHHREFMALKAAGIGVFRIVRPLFVASAVTAALSLALAEWLLPPTLAETNRIWHEEVSRKIPKGVERNGRYFHRGHEGIYSFIRPNPNEPTFTSFTYVTWDASYRLQRYLTAEKAFWKDGLWHLAMAQSVSGPGAEEDRTELHPELTLVLPESPSDFFVPAYKSDEKSLSRLIHEARLPSLDRHETLVRLHGRFSFVLFGIPLLLIGLPALMAVHRRWGRDLTLAVPLSCGIAFVFWSLWSTAQSMARAEAIPPWAASWVLHVAMIPLGLWLLRQQDS